MAQLGTPPPTMPIRTPSQPVFDKTRNRWKATVPASLSDNSQRLRSWHPAREAARAYLDGITGSATPTAIISTRLASQADEAREILEPLGMGLVDAARILAAVIAELAGAGTPLEAAKAWRQAHIEREASMPLGKAITLFLATRDGLRLHTIRGYGWYLGRVLEPLHQMILADITADDLNAVLAPRTPQVRRSASVMLGTCWRWCALPPRGWCKVSVLEGLEPVRLSQDAEIVCLSPEEAAALLRAAEATGPGCAVAFAIAIFGGVRMLELEKLTWGAITESNVVIDASVAKRHARRLIPICPSLRSWLDCYRGDFEDDDPVVGPNWLNTSKIARRRAGWDLSLPHIPKGLALPPITRGAWPKNVCRHTCASTQIAIGTPLDDLNFKFGHSGGSKLLKSHYIGRLAKKQALEILSIGPKNSKIAQLQAVG